MHSILFTLDLLKLFKFIDVSEWSLWNIKSISVISEESNFDKSISITFLKSLSISLAVVNFALLQTNFTVLISEFELWGIFVLLHSPVFGSLLIVVSSLI